MTTPTPEALWNDLLLALAELADYEGTTFFASTIPTHAVADISDVDEVTGKNYNWLKIKGNEVADSAWTAIPVVSTRGESYFFAISDADDQVYMGPLTEHYAPGMGSDETNGKLVDFLNEREEKIEKLQSKIEKLEAQIEKLQDFKF